MNKYLETNENIFVLPRLGGSAGWSTLLYAKGCGFESSQGTDLGCRLDPSWGAWGRQPMDVSLSVSVFLSPPLPLSLKKKS